MLAWVGLSFHTSHGAEETRIEDESHAAAAERQLPALSGRERSELLIRLIEYCIIVTNYDRGWELANQLEVAVWNDPAPDLQGKYHLMRSRLLVHRNDRAGALTEAETARRFAEMAEDPDLSNEVNRALGNVFMTMYDYAKALEYFTDALEDARRLENNQRVAVTLNSIAVCYWRMRQWKAAEQYLRQAKDFYLEDQRMKLMFENNIAVALMEQGIYEEAEQLLLSASQNNKGIGNDYSFALNASNMGDLYQRMQRHDESRRYLQLAIDFGVEHNNPFVLARSYRHLARLLADLGQIDEAIAYCHQSIETAGTIDDPAEQLDSWEVLIGLLEQAGRFEEALVAFRNKIGISEQLLSNQAVMRSVLFRVQFATAEQERAVAALQQERRVDGYKRNATTVVLIAVLLIAMVLLHRYRFARRAHAQITEQKNQVQLSHKELERAHEKLADLNREKDEILGIAAHDLRNPMSSVRQLATLMLEEDHGLSAAERREFLQDIATTSDNMLEIVSKLLEVNRLESGSVIPHCESTRVVSLFDACEDSFELLAKRKNQSLEFRSDHDDLAVFVDPLLTRQILDNLVSNALKYSPEGGQITVSACVSPDRPDFTRIAIADNGPGIAAEEMGRLFAKFARLSSRPTGGETSTGLGLSIVSKLTEILNGKVWCESVHGHGATFILELPRSSARTPQPAI